MLPGRVSNPFGRALEEAKLDSSTLFYMASSNISILKASTYLTLGSHDSYVPVAVPC